MLNGAGGRKRTRLLRRSEDGNGNASDQSAVELQASKSWALFSKIQESRTVMLYRAYMILTPDQYKKLQAIFERQREADHGRGRRNDPRP